MLCFQFLVVHVVLSKKQKYKKMDKSYLVFKLGLKNCLKMTQLWPYSLLLKPLNKWGKRKQFLVVHAVLSKKMVKSSQKLPSAQSRPWEFWVRGPVCCTLLYYSRLAHMFSKNGTVRNIWHILTQNDPSLTVQPVLWTSKSVGKV